MQNLVADAAKAAGYRVRSPNAMTPQYDVVWVGRGKRVVCEVKSLTATNEPQQIRLGLGQVLDYRHAMSHPGRLFSAVLAVSHEPEDPRRMSRVPWNFGSGPSGRYATSSFPASICGWK
jgi:hypothetical protein